jgi:hypothetical protein
MAKLSIEEYQSNVESGRKAVLSYLREHGPTPGGKLVNDLTGCCSDQNKFRQCVLGEVILELHLEKLIRIEGTKPNYIISLGDAADA